MKIYILTYGRPHKQTTANELNEARIPFTFVLSKSDPLLDEYKADFKDASITVASNGATITEKRQWLFERARGKFIMLDDDLWFRRRKADGSFVRAKSADLAHMFQHIERLLDWFAHGGIVDEFMCHTRPRGQKLGGRYNQLLAYNKDMMPRPYPKFRVPVGEEHDVNLQLQARGLVSCVNTEWTKHAGPYYAPGGCSDSRASVAKEREAQKQFQRLWPHLCQIKPSKGSRTGIRVAVAWRKALVKP